MPTFFKVKLRKLYFVTFHAAKDDKDPGMLWIHAGFRPILLVAWWYWAITEDGREYCLFVRIWERENMYECVSVYVRVGVRVRVHVSALFPA